MAAFDSPLVVPFNCPLTAGRVAGLIVEFDHNGDQKADGTAITGADGSFSYEPAGLLSGQNVVIHARVGYWDYAGGAYVDGLWIYSIEFDLTEDIPGKPQLDSEIVSATAPNALADRSLTGAVNATLREIFGAGADAVDVGVGTFAPLRSGNSQIAGGEALSDHDQSPLVLTGGLPGNVSQSTGNQHLHETSGGRTLDSYYSWSFSTSVNTSTQTIDVLASLTMTFESTETISAGLSQTSDSESHSGNLHQYGAYSFSYTTQINYSQNGGSVLYTGGTQSLTERSDYRYEHTDTVFASTTSAGGRGTSSTTTNTDGRYYYLYTETGGFDGNAPLPATLSGQSNSFANWSNGDGPAAPSFAAFSNLPSPGALPSEAAGSPRSFAFASGLSTHASTTGSGNSLQTTGDSQTQNNFNFASAVSFDQQIVGAGSYAENSSGYWSQGVVAANNQASRTASSAGSATLHSAGAGANSAGTSSSQASSNFSLSLAVITNYAIANTSGPSASSSSTTSDTFSYQDRFQGANSSQGAGSYSTDSNIGPTQYESDGDYQVNSSTSVNSSYLAIGSSTQSRASLPGGGDAAHSLLSMNYVAQNSASGSFSSSESGNSQQSSGSASDGSNTQGAYNTASSTTYSSSMTDTGSSIGPDGDVISQGQVALSLNSATSVAYAATGGGTTTAGNTQTTSNSSVGQTSTSDQGSSQNYHYVSVHGHYSADGTQSSNSHSTTRLASQTTGTVSDISGSSPQATSQFKSNEKSTATSTNGGSGSFRIDDGVQTASGSYTANDSTQRHSTSLTRDVSNTEQGNSATSLSRSTATETAEEDGSYTIGPAGTSVSGDTTRTSNRSGDTQTDVAFKHVAATGNEETGSDHDESGTRQTVSAYTLSSTDEEDFEVGPGGRHSAGSFTKNEASYSVSNLNSSVTDSSRSTTTNSSNSESSTVTLVEKSGSASKSSENSDYAITAGVRTASGDTTSSETRFAVTDSQSVRSSKSSTPNSTLGVREGHSSRSSSTTHAENREDSSYDGSFVQGVGGTTSEGDVTRKTAKQSNSSGMSLSMETSSPLNSGDYGTRSAKITGAMSSGSAEATYSHDGTQDVNAAGRTTLELTFDSTDKSNSSTNSVSFVGAYTTGSGGFRGLSATVGTASSKSTHDAKETDGVYNTYDNGTLRSADYESTDTTDSSSTERTVSGEFQASLGSTWTTHYAYSTSSMQTTQDSSVTDKGHYSTINGDRTATGTTKESANNKTETSGSSYRSDTTRTGLYSILSSLTGSSDNTTVESRSQSTATGKQTLDDGAYTQGGGANETRSGTTKTKNKSKAQSESTTTHTYGKLDSSGETKHDNSESVAKQTETKSKKENQTVGVAENTLASQHVKDEVFAKTSSEEWGDFVQAPGDDNSNRGSYTGSGWSTYKSKLKSDTADGEQGAQSYKTKSKEHSQRVTNATNATLEKSPHVWESAVTTFTHDQTSDYEAKHDFTLDAAGVQTAAGGTLKSNFVNDDKTVVTAEHHRRTDVELAPGTTGHDTYADNGDYTNTITAHADSHDQGTYAGIVGGGDYSQQDGTVSENESTTDVLHWSWKATRDWNLVYTAGGWDKGRKESDAHGSGGSLTGGDDWLAGGSLPQAGDSTTTNSLERTTEYTATSSKNTKEIKKKDYVSTYFVRVFESHEWPDHSATYDDRERLPYSAHRKLTTDADGKVADKKSSDGEYRLTRDYTADGEPVPRDPQIIPFGASASNASGRVQASGGRLKSGNVGIWDAAMLAVDRYLWTVAAVGLTAADVALSTFSESTYLDHAKNYAWRGSGLNYTIVPQLVEGGLTIAREIGIAYATGGGSLACGTGRLAASGMALARTALIARDVHEGYSNAVTAYQDFKDGNVWTGLYHSVLAGVNFSGAAGGLKALKSDVHLAAFPNAHCFPAGTPIATEHGLLPIESVEQNERVWSFDLATGKWELCRVAETYEREHQGPLVKVFVAGSAIESTYHHPYWVVAGEDLADRPRPDHVQAATVRDAIIAGRWVDAGDLRIGDVLLLQDGRRLPIEEILVRQATCRVYNLAVEGLRNYAVGPCSVLAHNMCAVANDAGHLYETGLAKDLRKNPVSRTQVNHAPQSREAELLIGDFNPRNKVGNEAAIRLPIEEHNAVSAAQRLRTSTASARDLLASDIQLLRQNTKAPNSALRDLIDLSKKQHPFDYMPLHRMNP